MSKWRNVIGWRFLKASQPRFLSYQKSVFTNTNFNQNDVRRWSNRRRWIYFSYLVQWLDLDKTLREQGIDETHSLLLKRKFFYSDQNVDIKDPVQLNLLYMQVFFRAGLFCVPLNARLYSTYFNFLLNVVSWWNYQRKSSMYSGRGSSGNM